MTFFSRWFPVLFALIASAEWTVASASQEDAAYASAVSSFRIEMYGRAEGQFSQFIEKFPKSAHVPEALLDMAQAQYAQGKYAQAIDLLSTNKSQAGAMADQYVRWIGEAQFGSGDYSAAAKTFLDLPNQFPKSPLILRATVDGAAALAQLGQWKDIDSLLEHTNGVFQNAVRADGTNSLVFRGLLLLAQAKTAQGNYSGGMTILDSLNHQSLQPDLEWQRLFLICQNRKAAGDAKAALAAATNLVGIGDAQGNGAWRAQGRELEAELYEKLNDVTNAVAAYLDNIVASAPQEFQRRAILKLASLSISESQITVAISYLQKFLAQFPNAPLADLALLTLSELQLKNVAANPPGTALVASAHSELDQFLNNFPNSTFKGKAFLNRGWCFWLEGKVPESLADFQKAAALLPFSEDLAVAKFKIGDALFAQADYAGAMANYSAVLNDFPGIPSVKQLLGGVALYQRLRANLELKHFDAAQADMEQLLKLNPGSDMSQAGALLFGKGLRDPRQARAQFEKFNAGIPDSRFRPQVDLAIAQTYEREQLWTNAVAGYQDWLTRYPTNALRPQVQYAEAWAAFQAGNETLAFNLFTNFVAQYSPDTNAPLAQWWIADHFYRAGDFVDAEKNYQLVYLNWPESGLAFQAKMMAGRSAVGRTGYSDAKDYFLNKVVADTNCPPELSVEARFAYGETLMLSDPTDTNKFVQNFELATNIFGQICQMYPSSTCAIRAWDEIGDCSLQLGDFASATNAYMQVIGSPLATVEQRSKARVGIGNVLVKRAAMTSGAEQTALQQAALDNYLQVFQTSFGENLRDGEKASPFWVKAAGLYALPLVQSLGVAQPDKFISQMETLLPQSMNSLERIRSALPQKK